MTATFRKIAALKAAKILRSDGLLAHHTATMPGVAAQPRSKAVQRLCRFKQRQGPFLLLADSVKTALRQARFYSPALRRLARSSWPGPVTLIVPARPGLPKQCYNRGAMAIRVDASIQTRQLAAQCGGLLLSSSLNRKGERTKNPDRKTQLRYQRSLHARLIGLTSSGKASTIIRVWRNHFTTIRP
ncbi:MAG: L-threonylcarbamoyladenylate synthase [Mariprofundus sp.]